MLIARLKKETNIVEYLIYMFQIEDIIRSFQFDLTTINENIVQQFDQPDEVKEEIKAWYQALIKEMKDEGCEKKGHINRLRQVINGLQVLHQTLLTTIQDKQYQSLFDEAKPALDELIKRSGGVGASNEVEIALNGVYGLLVLRLKKQTVASSTEEDLSKVSNLLAHLAHQYQQMKVGNLKLPQEKSN